MKVNKLVAKIIQTCTLLIFASLMVLTVESKSQNLVVTITVEPNRIIIIDKDFNIQKIFSNTKIDVRPTVYLESEDGLEVPYTESIMRQYQFLKPTLNFNEPGMIYERDDRPSIAFIKLIIRTLKKFVGMPF